jgi:uncharacterized membrane protein (DUF106 family)
MLPIERGAAGGVRPMSALNNPVVALIVSVIIAVGYFTLVDHYLMDMQGLDYWYLFRK